MPLPAPIATKSLCPAYWAQSKNTSTWCHMFPSKMHFQFFTSPFSHMNMLEMGHELLNIYIYHLSKGMKATYITCNLSKKISHV